MNAVFISGPYTGRPFAKLAFARAARELKQAGFRPIDPTRIVPREWDWGLAMELCLKLIDISDAVLQLDGWNESVGAVREWHHAQASQKPIFASVDAIRRNRPTMTTTTFRKAR